MTILEKITAHKISEVAKRKELFPSKLLEGSLYYETQTVSLKKYIQNPEKSGIIAEFKRKSPSKGIINAYKTPEEVTLGYMQAGASALSVLTDNEFFGGKNEDLTEARKFNFCPILRKDFIVDEYQIIEAKSIGADAILLIANILTKEQVAKFAKFAKSLGLEVLFEIHDESELSKLSQDVDIIGVNNRDLKVFKTDVQISHDLFPVLPKEFVKVSESGIHTPETVISLIKTGYDGFLIGENFMKTDNPGKACRDFINAAHLIK